MALEHLNVAPENRAGIIGYLFAGRDAVRKKLTKLKPLKFNPTDYDLVIIGTPIWAYHRIVIFGIEVKSDSL